MAHFDPKVNKNREGKLFHEIFDTDNEFYARIDSLGGWPLGMKYVYFDHSDERLCHFSNIQYRDEWRTTIATSDGYYRYKLSPEAIEIIKAEAREKFYSKISGLL